MLISIYITPVMFTDSTGYSAVAIVIATIIVVSVVALIYGIVKAVKDYNQAKNKFPISPNEENFDNTDEYYLAYVDFLASLYVHENYLRPKGGTVFISSVIQVYSLGFIPTGVGSLVFDTSIGLLVSNSILENDYSSEITRGNLSNYLRRHFGLKNPLYDDYLDYFIERIIFWRDQVE